MVFACVGLDLICLCFVNGVGIQVLIYLGLLFWWARFGWVVSAVWLFACDLLCGVCGCGLLLCLVLPVWASFVLVMVAVARITTLFVGCLLPGFCVGFMWFVVGVVY